MIFSPMKISEDKQKPYGYKLQKYLMKSAALSFILIILAGNFWVTLSLFGGKVPDLIPIGFILGACGALLSGLGLLTQRLWLYVRERNNT